MRVYPFGKVPAIVQRTLLDQVTVGQQHRKLGLVGAQGDGVHGHHIGAVQKVSDTPETLGLTLREKRVLADIQAHQLGVFGGAAGGENLQLECIGQVTEHQLVALHLEGRALTVDQNPCQVQLFTIELEGLHWHVRVTAQLHFIEHARLGGVEVKTQVNRVNPVGGRAVVGAVGGVRSAF